MLAGVARLVLWDIDGTLLRGGGVGRDVFDEAVTAVLGRHPGDHRVRMGGKTDPQIALEILAFAALEEADAAGRLPAVLEALERALEAGAARLRAEGHVLPGVPEVLQALDADPSVRSTVLTGNTQANAAVKLAAFELTSWVDLEIGAFGSDDRDRTALVPVALERARRLRGLDIGPDAVWVVGDTPRDLACARAGGVRCALVATGHSPLDELQGTDADAVLEDLSDVDAVVKLLTAG
jgi:phosphoglycolate phosphatase-like HAD superfamily hydrolase